MKRTSPSSDSFNVPGASRSRPTEQSWFLSLGSNQGRRRYYLEEGLRRLSAAGLVVKWVSSIYETTPVEVTDQPDFLNLVCGGDESVDPTALLLLCHSVEADLQRVRRIPKGPRTIDIDVLLLGRRIIKQPELSVPHPRMTARRFVLVPLVEIAHGLRHPVSGRTMDDLLENCPDDSPVRRVGPSPTL